MVLAPGIRSRPMPDSECPSESSPSSLEGNRQHESYNTASRVRKRVVTAARREQNKKAQRAYRERQRDRRKSAAPRREGVRNIAPRPLSSSRSNSPPEPQISENVPVSDCQLGTASVVGDAEARTNTLEIRCADPLANTLQTTRDTIWLAVLNNALCLGFDLKKLAQCNTSYMSPFFRSITTQDSARDVVASSLNTSIPIHLQPTMAQILIPHHASLDLIPLPLLRERAIMMTFAMPDIFDLRDLKLDIYTRHALVCRRYLDDGACHPWHSRSWEAKPWFMRKWSLAIEG